ncbi:MAG: PilX N-terminal domain-containing pilus assembly protein [Motiliproteus sp.]
MGTYKTNKQHQQGIALIICMIVLVVLTISGLSSIRDTSMEERMAGNMKNRNLAFQAAESALREGEEFLNSAVVLPDFDGTGGLYSQFSSGAVTSMSSSWADPSAVRTFGGDSDLSTYNLSLPEVVAAPVYIIERMDSLAPTSSVEAGQAQDTVIYYRITTRAVGSTDTARVILQTVYRR